jgi:hypothetical protein
VKKRRKLAALVVVLLLVAGLGVWRYGTEPIGERYCISAATEAQYGMLGSFAHAQPCSVWFRVKEMF